MSSLPRSLTPLPQQVHVPSSLAHDTRPQQSDALPNVHVHYSVTMSHLPGSIVHLTMALRKSMSSKSIFLNGHCGCHFHVNFTPMMVLDSCCKFEATSTCECRTGSRCVAAGPMDLGIGTRHHSDPILTSALREPIRTKCTMCISISTTHAYLMFRGYLLPLSLYPHFFSHCAWLWPSPRMCYSSQ